MSWGDLDIRFEGIDSLRVEDKGIIETQLGEISQLELTFNRQGLVYTIQDQYDLNEFLVMRRILLSDGQDIYFKAELAPGQGDVNIQEDSLSESEKTYVNSLLSPLIGFSHLNQEYTRGLVQRMAHNEDILADETLDEYRSFGLRRRDVVVYMTEDRNVIRPYFKQPFNPRRWIHNGVIPISFEEERAKRIRVSSQ